MELENFSESTKIIVNAAFNYANENKFEFFNSVHLLKILIEKDSQVSETLSYFKVNKKNIIEDCQNIIKKESNTFSNTKIQGNLILLLEEANKKIKNIKKKYLDTNIILLELSSDISPNPQNILKK
ncbi:MAG: hypothetical protein CMP40_03555, partial [Rickettsiales bacterium]|nr:hypothetical protein [Rickettsiales bacterium]